MNTLRWMAAVFAIVGVINIIVGDEIDAAIYLVGSAVCTGFVEVINEMRRR